ncbi:GyrI-like domain-containing protein [Streptomyces fuscigenes]|uniref:GyrI-like domain-containing protein n=1 Tax=Streptomyces fuscigenes TaxID=1528880 RepID=UPI001F3C9DFA|nr:GyrI-like domain-containing protein [Streptomyces fuscigenes]MCF3963041.1 GyrI-like domain-containing protein [Streptomyces fuscigenes]
MEQVTDRNDVATGWWPRSPWHPRVVTRARQPYVGVRRLVTMDTVGEVARRLPELVGWVEDRGMRLAGPPFLRYHSLDAVAEMEVEAGVPLASAELTSRATGDMRAGTVPGGRYAVAVHLGPPADLPEATRRMLEWADAEGHVWDMTESGGTQRWGSRTESYLTDPREEPDPRRHRTELAFRLADRQ